MGRDDFDDADQLRIGNDGIFMLTFFSKYITRSRAPSHRRDGVLWIMGESD